MTKAVIEEQDLHDTPWHTEPGDEVVERLRTDPKKGLSKEDAKERLEEYGPNTIRESEGDPWWSILSRQFLDPLIYILILAGLVTLVFRDYIDSAVIFAAVLINGTIGFIQEYRAQKAITALAEMSAPKAHLRRDGETVEVPTDEVVPGDIVRLKSGTRVPADVRLLKAEDLRLDESALTGESEPVRNGPRPRTLSKPPGEPGSVSSCSRATIPTRRRPSVHSSGSRGRRRERLGAASWRISRTKRSTRRYGRWTCTPAYPRSTS